MTSQNYYQIFGIDKDSAQDEIKQAYLKLAHKYHPDKQGGNDQKMKEINFIYSILSDLYKRKSYNETLGAKEYFDNFNWDYQPRKSWINIYCDELEVVDSMGATTKVQVGQDIYCPVEIDKTVVTWKYKSKEYFNVYVKKIFDPEKKNYFADVLEYDLKKEPFCLAQFGEQDLIIYKEDFQSYWLSEESHKKIDLRKGRITAFFVIVILVAGIYYLFSTHQLTSEQRRELENNQVLSGMGVSQEYKDFLKKEYGATGGEINYIATNKYITCTKGTTKTTELAEVRNAPDVYALVSGKLPKDTEVKILLYFEDHNAYKIQSDKIIGWVPEKSLDKPICDIDQE